MRNTEFCKHYRAMSDHTTCEAGVAYDTFKGVPFEQRPCFAKGPDFAARPGCDLVQIPTKEEREERDKEIAKRFPLENMMVARAAIVESIGVPWKRGTPGASGIIDCPVCQGHKTLRFSRAGYNGHIHASCTTKDCVAWME